MNNTHDYALVVILPAFALFQLAGSENLPNSL